MFHEVKEPPWLKKALLTKCSACINPGDRVSLPDHLPSQDEVAEWLRRWTANPMCSARVGSNPILVVKDFLVMYFAFTHSMHFYLFIVLCCALYSHML